MIEDAAIDCPFCGERNALAVDITAGHQVFTEDCVVCCQPIRVTVEADAEHGIQSVEARAENE